MPLILKLTAESAIPLEVDSLTMGDLCELNAGEISRKTIQRGNKTPELGEFLAVTGSAVADQTVIWQGNCQNVKLIGAKMAAGTVVVDGPAGMHLGSQMTGGTITVAGDAADWIGAEMQGGAIHVQGNAGNLVGAAYRGSRRGMRGGTILIDGNAGQEVGHTMRRGLIAIRGNTGDAAGVNMIAGSIFIGGQPGIRNGFGMKRGSIVCLSSSYEVEVLPSFRRANDTSPGFVALYLQELSQLGFAVTAALRGQSYVRYCGDFLELGKGELLVAQP